jgi:hypothetical protein
MDPDPAIFVIDLQDASKKLIFNTIFSAYYFLKVHLQHFSKIKNQKESQNRRNQGFSYYFCIIEGSGSGSSSKSWCGSGSRSGGGEVSQKCASPRQNPRYAPDPYPLPLALVMDLREISGPIPPLQCG